MGTEFWTTAVKHNILCIPVRQAKPDFSINLKSNSIAENLFECLKAEFQPEFASVLEAVCHRAGRSRDLDVDAIEFWISGGTGSGGVAELNDRLQDGKPPASGCVERKLTPVNSLRTA